MDENSVVRKFRTTADDGKNYEVTYYNLDMIISLGYRIKSAIATRFRIWATQRLQIPDQHAFARGRGLFGDRKGDCQAGEEER